MQPTTDQIQTLDKIFTWIRNRENDWAKMFKKEKIGDKIITVQNIHQMQRIL